MLSEDDILAQFGAPPDEEFIEPNLPPTRAALPASRPAPSAAPQPSATRPASVTVPAAGVSPAPSVGSSHLTNVPNAAPAVAAAPSKPMSALPPALELWQRVLAEITDMLKSHAKAVTRASYPGEGRIEIAFPNKFQFSRRYCEKPDALRRLEDLVARIAGRLLKITITSCPDGADDVPTAIKSEAKKPARVYRPENDPYVVSVMNAFAAQVVKVDPIITSNPSSEE